jgi:hypothetical protein
MRLSADMADLDWQVDLTRCAGSRGKLHRMQPLWALPGHRFGRRVAARPRGLHCRLQDRNCGAQFRWYVTRIGMSTTPRSGLLTLKCIAAGQVPRTAL